MSDDPEGAMRQSSGISRIKVLIVAFFSFALAANGANAQEIVLEGYGPALENEKVGQAFVHAVDWQSLTVNIFDDPYIPVILYVPGVSYPLDNYSLEFNPELGYQLLHSTQDREGFSLALLYLDTPNMAQLAGGVADDLWKIGVEVTLYGARDEMELRDAEAYLRDEDVNSLVLRPDVKLN